MHIKELNISNFGKFHNKTLEFSSGINLIYGENEAGKSTIHSFIRGMLFGIERLRGRAAKDDIYIKYQPWDTPGAYNGSIDIVVKDKTYRIVRIVDKNNKDFTVFDIETGRELDLYGEDLIHLYGGLTESGYRNTVSVEQLKSKTDGELVDEVRNYITNLTLTKNKEVDITQALNLLQNKRKEIESEKLYNKIKELEEVIENGLKREETIDVLTLQLHKLERQEINLEKNKQMTNIHLEGMEHFESLEEYEAYLDSYPVMKEKYNIYVQELSHKEELERKLETLKNELQIAENASDELVILKEEINKVSKLNSMTWDAEEKRKQAIINYEELQYKVKSRSLWYLIPVIVGIIGCIWSLGKGGVQVGIFASIGMICISIYGYSIYQLQEKKKKYSSDLNMFDGKLTKIKEELETIFNKNHCNSEQEIQLRYEERIGYKMSQSHLKKQFEELKEEVISLSRKIGPIRDEILDYIKESPRIYQNFCITESEMVITTTIIRELELYIGNQKRIIAHQISSVQKDLEYLRLQKEKIKWELDSLEGNEDKLLRDKDKLNELLQKQKERSEELEAIQLSIETINSLSVDIHDSFGRDLNQLLSELAKEITAGKYDVLKVDEKLNIKVGCKNNLVLMDRLSTGTIEQLYLALRMAISNLLFKEETMPIILDDCFAYYDDNRTKAALEFLARKRQGQIILFTCHNREKIMLDEMNVNYNYINIT